MKVQIMQEVLLNGAESMLYSCVEKSFCFIHWVTNKSTTKKSAIILPASGSYLRLTSPRHPTISTDSHSICDSGISSASRPPELGTHAASISTLQSGNDSQILKGYISGVIKQGLSDLKRASLQESFKIREALLQYLGSVSSLKISFPKLQSFLEGLPKCNNINSHSDVLQWTTLQGELKGRIAVNSQKVTDLVEAKNEFEKEFSQVVEQITQLQAKEASIRNHLATQKAKINAAKLEVKFNEEALQAISSKLEAAVALVALSSQVDAQFRSEVSSFIFDE